MSDRERIAQNQAALECVSVLRSQNRMLGSHREAVSITAEIVGRVRAMLPAAVANDLLAKHREALATLDAFRAALSRAMEAKEASIDPAGCDIPPDGLSLVESAERLDRMLEILAEYLPDEPPADPQ